MKKILVIHRAVLISLIIIFIFNSIGYAKGSSIPSVGSNCGVWKIEGGNLSRDGRMWILPVTTGDENCTGLFSLSNHTSTVLGGGYTFELRDVSPNALTIFRDNDRGLLIPGLDIKIATTPVDRNAKATVTIYGDITLKAYTVDVSLFIIKTILEFSPLPTQCFISDEQIALIAIRAAPIVYNTATLAFVKGDLGGAVNEFSNIINVYSEKVGDYAVEAGISCGAELTKKIIAPIIPKLTLSFINWLGKWFFDFLKFKGASSSIILTYIPPTPPTPTSINLDMTNAVSIAVWINYGLQNGDGSVFNAFLETMPQFWAIWMPDYTSNTPPCQDLMGQWCDIKRDEFIQEIDKRIQSKPQCAYDSDGTLGFVVETFGWDPLWVWPFGVSDSVQFEFSQLDSEYQVTEIFRLKTVYFVQAVKLPWLADTPCP